MAVLTPQVVPSSAALAPLLPGTASSAALAPLLPGIRASQGLASLSDCRLGVPHLLLAR